jgi:hypothetical protein
MFKVNNTLSSLTPEGIYDKIKNDEYFSSKSTKITENALLFCTLLYLRFYYKKENSLISKDSDNNPFQGININIIIKILARDNYKEILQRLVELEIIEINNSYCTGLYPKSYRIHKNYIFNKPLARKIRNKSVLKKFNELQILSQQENFIENNAEFLLNQARNLKLIHIDFEKAHEWISTNANELKSNGSKIINNANYYIRSINAFNNGFNDKISISDKNHRVHSSMTSFPKKLRKFLCLVDKNTGEMIFDKYEIDGKNTQPLLICLKMKQEGFEPDYDFINACLNGTIYDLMAEEMNESRNCVKEYMMKAILFTNGNCKKVQRLKKPIGDDIYKQKISLYFYKRFPNVYNWLLNKKNELKKSTLESNNYFNKGGSLLAIEIQKMEAELWINNLLPEIPKDIIYATIHDSIIIFNSNEENSKLVLDKIQEISKKLYQIELPLHTNHLS